MKKPKPKSKPHRLTNVIYETRPFNKDHDGSETGDFQTYVKKKRKVKR